LALAVVLCGLTGCGAAQEDRVALTVNGTPLDAEIFRYYLDLAFADASLSGKDARINSATEQCIRYVAVNSAFASRGLALTDAQTAETSERGNALWNIFGEHYTKVGVSKQTFMKLQTSQSVTEQLRHALYDTGGAAPLPDDELKTWFAAAYAAFKVVRSTVYGADVYGNRVPFTEEQLAAVREKYNAAADVINKGAGADYAFATLISTGTVAVQQSMVTEVIADGDPYYPAGFYGAVRSVEEGKAAVFLFEDEIFLVYRVDILADGDLFKRYRDTCLIAVSEPYLQNEINTMCNGYSSVRNTSAVQSCYEQVRQGRK
jgi:hypothetical protein